MDEFRKLKPKGRTIQQLTAMVEAAFPLADDANPPTEKQLEQLSRDARNSLKDPHEMAAYCRRVLDECSKGHSQGGYEYKIVMLMNDPWGYYEGQDTGYPIDSLRDKALKQAWIKKFLKDHPAHDEGYIGSFNSHRKWRRSLDMDAEVRKPRAIDPAKKAKCIDRMKAGGKENTLKAISEQEGVSTGTLYNWKEEAGLVRKGRKTAKKKGVKAKKTRKTKARVNPRDSVEFLKLENAYLRQKLALYEKAE